MNIATKSKKPRLRKIGNYWLCEGTHMCGNIFGEYGSSPAIAYANYLDGRRRSGYVVSFGTSSGVSRG